MSAAPSPLAALARIPWSRVPAWLVLLGAGAATARLALELARRAAFPWDLLLWSESPFMTDMLKLARGQSPFSPAADGNSFTYSPGLEYLSYAIFAPFGVALDVRFPRALCTALGVAAALLLARLVLRWVSALEGERPRPLLACGAFFVAFLALFRSPTTCGVHPDTLHMLHGFLTLTLCSAALARQDFRLALAAMGLAGLGIWTKQPAALAALGAGAALALGHVWGRNRLLVLLGTGAAVTLASVACLVGPEQSRFYLLEVPLRHGVEPSKLIGLALSDIGGSPYRLLIWTFGATALAQLWSRADPTFRRVYLTPWLCIGAFDSWVSLAAYLKPMGIYNNLHPIDLWWLVAALVGFARLDAGTALERRPFDAVLPACLAFTLIPIFESIPYHGGFVFPNQLAIRDAQYAYGREVDALVKRDLEAGRRVLLGHGTTSWIHNDVLDPPLDRMVSALELEKSGLADSLGTARRLAERTYDRIYMPSNTPWFDASMYGPEVNQALAANYREVAETLLAPPLHSLVPNDGLMLRILVLEPRTPALPGS